ncbi:hypothetical protein [Halostella litorea]|uniref:hypothetical protein n=1 Tax=Halostella litorea TaxID=2528831 RepID=UPI0010924240|nr:hypothetical protein [Halostella litorea]
MSLDRSLPLAVAFGLLAGGLVREFLLTHWFPALGVAAVYAGAAYFYLAFDLSLLGTQVEFTSRRDRVGYAVGLFGLSVSPLAFGEYAGLSEPTVFGLIVWLMGAIAFLLLSTAAAHE